MARLYRIERTDGEIADSLNRLGVQADAGKFGADYVREFFDWVTGMTEEDPTK